MKSQDIVILLKLVPLNRRASANPSSVSSLAEAVSARSLEKALAISKSEVNASINRSAFASLHYCHPIVQ